MSDARQRRLRAKVMAGQATEAEQARYLSARIRTGELSPVVVEYLARAGHPVARAIYPEAPVGLLFDLVRQCDEPKLLPLFTRWAAGCVARGFVGAIDEAPEPNRLARELAQGSISPVRVALSLTYALLDQGPTLSIMSQVTAYDRVMGRSGAIYAQNRNSIEEAANYVLRAAAALGPLTGNSAPHKARFHYLANAISITYQALGSKRSERAWQHSHLVEIMLREH